MASKVIYFSYTNSLTILSSTSAVYLRPMTIPARPRKYWQYNGEDYRCTKRSVLYLSWGFLQPCHQYVSRGTGRHETCARRHHVSGCQRAQVSRRPAPHDRHGIIRGKLSTCAALCVECFLHFFLFISSNAIHGLVLL